MKFPFYIIRTFNDGYSQPFQTQEEASRANIENGVVGVVCTVANFTGLKYLKNKLGDKQFKKFIKMSNLCVIG